VALAGTRAWTTRRILFEGRTWIATLELQELLALTFPLGLIHGGGGYELRPTRLQRAEPNPGTAPRLHRLEDLGPVASVLPGKIDAYSNWVVRAPGAGVHLTLTNGSANVGPRTPTSSTGDR
jgi:hypothetical protein